MSTEPTRRKSLEGKMVSIVIPALENIELTRNCWSSIQKNTAIDHEIILVDNGSKQPLAEEAKAAGIYCIRNERNLGFAAAVNQGLRAAQGDILVVLNNDTLVTPQWMERLLRHFVADPGLGILAPVTNYANNAIQRIDSDYNDETTLYQFSEKRYRSHQKECIEQNKIAGVCMVIPRPIMEKVGLFDTRFGIGNFEDDDYCLRVRQAGYRVGIANDVFIHHEGGRTFQLLDIDYAALLDHNSQLFLQKWAPVLGVHGAVQAGADQAKLVKASPGVSTIVLQDEQTLSMQAIETILETLPETSSVQLVCEKSAVASQCAEIGIPVVRVARQDLLRAVDRQIRDLGTTHALIVSSRLIAEPGWVDSLLVNAADAALVLPEIPDSLEGQQQRPESAQGFAVLVETCAYSESGGLSAIFDSGVAWEELGLRMEDAGLRVESIESQGLSLRDSSPTVCRVDPGEQRLVQSLVDIKQRIVEGQLEGALNDLEKLLDDNGDFVQAHEWKGILHTDRQEWELARAAFKRVVDLAPDHAGAQNHLGCLEYSNGNLDEAVVHFETAMRLQPNNIDAARNLAHLCFESGEAQRALDLYVGIVQKAPNDPQSYLELGIWYEKLTEVSGARDLYRQALQVAPDCQEAQERLEALDARQSDTLPETVAQP